MEISERPAGTRALHGNWPSWDERVFLPDLAQRRVEDFDRVLGHTTGPVEDLVAATGARRGDHGVLGGGAHRGEKDQLADLLRHLEVLLLVTKGTGHAAAA